MSREVKNSEGIMGMIIIVLLIVIMSLVTGCGTYKFAVAGQSLDMATTAYGLSNTDLVEGNFWSSGEANQDIAVLAIIKTVILFADWKCGNETTHNIVGGAGFLAGLWNLNKINEQW